MRNTPANEHERRQAAMAYLRGTGLPDPVFHFIDAGFQGGVRASWPLPDGQYLSHAKRFQLATQYVVTDDELDAAAAYLREWHDAKKQAETEAAS